MVSDLIYKCRAVARGLQPPQCLAEQLTLSQTGGQIMPTTVLQAPRIFRPCDGPVTQLKVSKSQKQNMYQFCPIKVRAELAKYFDRFGSVSTGV